MDGTARLPVLERLEDRWAFKHRCDRTATGRGVYVVSIPLHPAHNVTDDGATVTPSILCDDCGTHGFWTDGEWRPC